MVDNIYNKLSEERKAMQEEGTLPEWYSTGGWQMFKKKYLFEANTWKEQIDRICRTAARHTDDPEHWESKFFELFWKGWLSPSTPVLANTGTDRGLPVACSGCYTADNVPSFYDTAKEIAVLSQKGFGTSAYLGDIRPRGTAYGKDGKADGVMPVVKLLVETCRHISQGSSRRGSGAWYYPIDGGDFKELVAYLESNPDDLNIGWNIGDNFIQRLQDGDEEALDRFQEALKVKMTVGKGYFCFIDKVNRQRPAPYIDKGLNVKASQLCVTGDQRVVSDRGLVTASMLYKDGGSLTLHDNTKAVSSSKMKLIEEGAEVYTIALANGMTHTITEEHKVKTSTGVKKLCELNIGDKVCFQTNRGIFGDIRREDEAFLLGLWQADGTSYKEQRFIDIWEDSFDLEEDIVSKVSRVYDKYGDCISSKRSYPKPRFTECTVAPSVTGVKVRKKRLTSVLLSRALDFEKGKVPWWVWEGDEATQWQYIKGLFYADGTVNISPSKGNPMYLSIANTNKEFLKDLQIILANLGLKFAIHLAEEAGSRKLPDGKGGYAYYDCKACYRLVCGNKPDALVFEKNTGFLSRKGVALEDRKYRDNTRKNSEIVSIEFKGHEDVYCVEVDTEDHLWVCNGIITHNCSEIFLHSSEDYTYTCILSSMVVAKYDEWKDTDAVFVATVFLDCICSEFIEIAKDIPELKKAISFTKKGRALGLGQMGLFSLFQKRRISPESFDAHMLNIEVAKHIAEKSDKASEWMAEQWGEPEWCKGYGKRNTHVRAIAPTKSTALLMGGWSEGINPEPAMAYSASSAAGDIDRASPVLVELMKEKGLDVPKCIKDILANKGSVKGLAWLSEEEQSWFRTAFEMNQETLIRYASCRQPHLDQGQSTNVFFGHDADEAKIASVHKQAFLDENILSLYYIYSSSELSAETTECEACQ